MSTEPSLEQGQTTVESVSQTVSAWKVIRYLLWAYSFKLGIYFFILGVMFRTEMLLTGKWMIGIGGIVYIAFVYIPLPNPTSIVFGLAGGLMTVALSPEKMIAYGLQGEAASFAFHVLFELVLGWVFIALSLRQEKDFDVSNSLPNA